jgi:hypothetical protein
MPPSETGDLTRAQYYDRIRSQIEHEDELINLRVVWQLLAQSFFFSTYASAANCTEGSEKRFVRRGATTLAVAGPVRRLIRRTPHFYQHLYLPRQYCFSSREL